MMIVDKYMRPRPESPPLPAVESTLQHCILAGQTKKSTIIIVSGSLRLSCSHSEEDEKTFGAKSMWNSVYSFDVLLVFYYNMLRNRLLFL